MIFLLIVVFIYWRLNRQLQNRLLLTASLIFYASWDWRYLFLLLLSTGIDFFAAIEIHKANEQTRRKAFLVLSVGINLLILGCFKYFNFFMSGMDSLLLSLGFNPHTWHLSLILPIGISFYTFQAISYVVDVYRRELEPTDSLENYVLFICFFPQLVAGPIERACNLLTQFANERQFVFDKFKTGLSLILWGLLKKVVIADNVSFYVDQAFGVRNPSTLLIICATFGYGLQIYSDFSGYSDIARGSARLLGFELMANFNSPYLARNPQDFWKRWHISLSNFVRDYIYLPLGGSHCSKLRYVFNLLMTWLLMGLWHGAAVPFLLWGLWHGMWISIWKFFRGRERTEISTGGAFDFFSIGFTFVLMNLGWLLFRAKTLSQLSSFFSSAALKQSIPDFRISYLYLLIFCFYSLPLWLALLGKSYLKDHQINS